MEEQRHRRAEAALWHSVGAQPSATQAGHPPWMDDPDHVARRVADFLGT